MTIKIKLPNGKTWAKSSFLILVFKFFHSVITMKVKCAPTHVLPENYPEDLNYLEDRQEVMTV